MAKPTVRFYNSYGNYMGWKYLSKVTFFELKNWLISGNSIFYKEQMFDSNSNNNDLFLLLRKSK